MLYNYRKFGLAVLTAGLKEFEAKHTNNITTEAMDKIWDIELVTSVNKRIKRVFGRYYPRLNRIEMFPEKFDNNLLAYKDTILHELAHHITDILYGNVQSHGREWRIICGSLGCDNTATKKLSDFDLAWQQSKNIEYYSQYKL